MEIHLNAKHLKITPAISTYVREKVEKAQRYFDHIIWAQVILFIEKRSHNAEIVLHAPQHTFRALATAVDLYSAVDLASDKIDAQLKKFKERLKNRKKHNQARAAEAASDGVLVAPAPIRAQVVKQPVSPMTPDQAAAEMEKLGQAFRLFQDRDSRQINVIYRASDDSYKILQPVRKTGRA
ncbi:MAG: ribosome-associated translation inhibitor RaiA [Elusimicrobia bacterium]|nr:ribosome-associated translation inhibitor RaiA [Elusimicrobiota bacterium]